MTWYEQLSDLENWQIQQPASSAPMKGRHASLPLVSLLSLYLSCSDPVDGALSHSDRRKISQQILFNLWHLCHTGVGSLEFFTGALN